MIEYLKENQLLSALIMFLLFRGASFVAAIVAGFKKNKKFINMGEYINNGFTGDGISMKGWAGITVPQGIIADKADSKYLKISTATVIVAMPEVHRRMVALDYTRAMAKHRLRDCDDYAKRMMVELNDVLFIKFKNDPNALHKGIPVGTFGFKTDKGEMHEVMYVVTNEGTLYFEIFPETKYLDPRKMSKKELSSGFKVM